MNLSAAQIQAYAAAAGFSGADLATAVAIALAESFPSGNPNSYNPEGSYGLWQIYLPMHPEYAGVNLYDPQTNANAAFAIYSAAGGRFTPWSTFNSGAYAKYLAAVAGDASLTLQTTTPNPGFTPSTSVMTLFPTTISPNSPSATDFGAIALALALGAGVLFAFSEA